MNTKLNNFIIMIMFFTLLVSCSSNNDMLIGISIGPNNERWDKDRDLMVERLEFAGAEVIVKQAQNDEALQKEQINELRNKKVDVMIIIPLNSESCGMVINEMKQENKKLKIIAYDRIIKNCDIDLYISFDNVKVGELQAEYLTKIKPTGNYVILGGSPKDNNSQLLKLGQMNVLQPLITKGDITLLLDDYVENWNAQNAYNILIKLLNTGVHLDAVIASSDEIAKGAHLALEEKGLAKKVLLSGQDAEADACRRIDRGEQTMTVYKYIESLAHSTANIAILMAKDQTVPNTFVTVNNGNYMVPAILLPSMIQVHKENIRMTVIADGYLDEKEVFDN